MNGVAVHLRSYRAALTMSNPIMCRISGLERLLVVVIVRVVVLMVAEHVGRTAELARACDWLASAWLVNHCDHVAV